MFTVIVSVLCYIIYSVVKMFSTIVKYFCLNILPALKDDGSGFQKVCLCVSYSPNYLI